MVNGGDHRLQVFDATSGEKIRDNLSVPTCSENRDMGVHLHVSPDGRNLFIVCIDTGTVSVVGLTDGAVTKQLPGIGDRIAGSATSPDGRELFVLSYADGMYTVAVVDTEISEVMRQRSMIHAESTSQLLPLIALSGNGARLIIGIDDLPGDAEAAAHTFFTFDAETLQPVVELELDATIDAHPPVAASNGTSFFVISRLVTPEGAFQQKILRIAPEGIRNEIGVLDREEVIVMLTGEIHLPEEP